MCLVSQMGLLLDLDGGMNDEGNDDELEAELMKLMGGGGGGGGGKAQGKKGDGKGDKVISFPHQIHLSLHVFTFNLMCLVMCSSCPDG